jgi:hypothetical protein
VAGSSGGSTATGGSGGVDGGGVDGGGAFGGNAGSVATGGTGGTTPTFNPVWWDPSYKSRWNIHVSAPTALPQGFQVPLPVQAASIDGSSAPFTAWRIVRWDGSSWTEHERLIETVAGKPWIWFRTATSVTGSDDSYWLYAANPAAPAAVSGAGVFELLSELGKADTSTWVQTGNVSYDGSRAILDGSGGGASLRTNGKTYGPGFGVDFAMTVITPLASSSISPNNWKGSNVPPDTGKEHVYSVERFSSKHKFLYDLANKDATTWGSSYTQALQLRFSAYNGSKIGVRWARVRKTADPPPQATLGAKEAHP